MQNRETLSGFVLHKRPYRETSLLIDFFSLEWGRVSAVAKGARGSAKSDRKSLLQAFQFLECELGGRSALKNMARVEAKSSALQLQGNSLYCGFYINEILTRALPESEPYSRLFTIYQQTLQQLATLDSEGLQSHEILLREFELSLLFELGYLPDFEYDALSNEPISDELYYQFNPANGFEQSNGLSKQLILGKYISAIAKGEYFSSSNDASKVRKAAKYICRLALAEVIGSKPIKSRELFL